MLSPKWNFKALVQARNGINLIWLILILGACFRLYAYLGDRSLWLDESMVALNITSRAPQDLLQPLDYTQFAPAGWLLVTKLFHMWLGGLEYALRLPSLLFGLALLAITAIVALRSFDRLTAAFLCLLVAASPYLVRYSSEVKPYGVDAFLTMAVFALSWSLLHARRFDWQSLTALFGVGIVAIPISHPVALTLGAAGGALFFAAIDSRNHRAAAAIFLISALWLTEFVTLYLGIYQHQLSRIIHGVQTVFSSRQIYAPFPPHSLSDLVWYPKAALDLFIYVFNRPSVFAAGCAYFLGLIWLLRRDAWTLALLTLPILAALAASMVHAYPFEKRFLLFAAPLMFVTVAYGVGAIVEVFRGNLVPAMAISGLIVIPVAGQTLGYLANPSAPFALEEMKPALRDLASRRQEDDVIYLFYNAQPPYEVYKSRYGLSKVQTIAGFLPDHDWACYLYDVKRISHYPRVWLLFSHLTDEYGMDEVEFLSYFAGLYGKELWSANYPGASLRLFAFDDEAAIRAEKTLPIGDPASNTELCYSLKR